jgi:hypothetical protein
MVADMPRGAALRFFEGGPAFAEGLARLSAVHDGMIWYVYERSDARDAAVREPLDRARQLKPGAVDVLHAMKLVVDYDGRGPRPFQDGGIGP